MFHRNGHGEWFYFDQHSETDTQAFKAASKSATFKQVIVIETGKF